MAPTIIRRVEDLIPCVEGGPLVVVDGRNGVGKSTLARDLATRLGGTRIAVDDFFQDLRGRDTRRMVYADCLDHESLRSRVESARASGPVMLDGLCILDVARRLGVRPDAHILVSAIDPAHARFVLGGTLFDYRLGNVVDAALLDDAVGIGDLELAMEVEQPGVNDIVQRSIVRYFKADRPHHAAHVVYIWRR